jgi:hypothetical protein
LRGVALQQPGAGDGDRHRAIYDIVGFAGAAVFVAAYFANQQRWLRSEDWRYPFANLVGAVLILVSLVFEWNFPSVVIEVFWAIISLYGMAKSLCERASP